MVKKVKINPNGGRIKIAISYKGLIVASYVYQLWEAESNDVITTKKGNNQNTDDDAYFLPMPVSYNIGRIIDVRSRFVGLDPDVAKKYEVKIEVFQGDKFIDEAVDAGELGTDSNLSQIFIFLESNQ